MSISEFVGHSKAIVDVLKKLVPIPHTDVLQEHILGKTPSVNFKIINKVVPTIDLHEYIDSAKPASFGLGGENVYDESYRKAKSYSFNYPVPDAEKEEEEREKNYGEGGNRSEIITCANCLEKVEYQYDDYYHQGNMVRFCKFHYVCEDCGKQERDNNEVCKFCESKPALCGVDACWLDLKSDLEDFFGCKNLRVFASKIAIYDPGCFFKRHLDTLKSSHHVGTLLIGTDYVYSGGGLIFTHLSQEEFYLTNSTHAIFTTDCFHEILPVKSGRRVVIQYDIYLPHMIIDFITPVEPSPKRARIGEKTHSDVSINSYFGHILTLTQYYGSICIPTEHLYPLGHLDNLDILKLADKNLADFMRKHRCKIHLIPVVLNKKITDEYDSDAICTFLTEAKYKAILPRQFFSTTNAGWSEQMCAIMDRLIPMGNEAPNGTGNLFYTAAAFIFINNDYEKARIKTAAK